MSTHDPKSLSAETTIWPAYALLIACSHLLAARVGVAQVKLQRVFDPSVERSIFKRTGGFHVAAGSSRYLALARRGGTPSRFSPAAPAVLRLEAQTGRCTLFSSVSPAT